MKRRTFCFILGVFLMLGMLILPCAATPARAPETVVYDRADLLTEGHDHALSNAVRDGWESMDECGFFVATHKMERSYDPYYTGEDFLDDRGWSYRQNLVILIITLDDGVYYYDMYYYGKASRVIHDEEVDYILDHEDVYGNIKSGKLVEGASAFMSLAAQAYEGRIAGASYAVIITVSLIIALISGVIACAGVKASYSTKKKSVDYPLDRFAKLQLTSQNDVFVGSFVTKRIIETNSGGGHGGGGRGGGRGHAGGR